MILLQRSKSFLQSRWFPPTLHIVLFAVTWFIAYVQAEPLLDGPARWGFLFLLITDFPISVAAFSKMWDGHWALGISLWGTLGTAWWYLLGVWIYRMVTRIQKRGGSIGP
jgi:hypothetical protein